MSRANNASQIYEVQPGDDHSVATATNLFRSRRTRSAGPSTSLGGDKCRLDVSRRRGITDSEIIPAAYANYYRRTPKIVPERNVVVWADGKRPTCDLSWIHGDCRSYLHQVNEISFAKHLIYPGLVLVGIAARIRTGGDIKLLKLHGECQQMFTCMDRVWDTSGACHWIDYSINYLKMCVMNFLASVASNVSNRAFAKMIKFVRLWTKCCCFYSIPWLLF